MFRWCLLLLLVGAAGCVGPDTTPPVPSPTPTVAPSQDPAGLSQAGLAALIVDQIESFTTLTPFQDRLDEILLLIGRYRATYGGVSQNDVTQLSDLEHGLASIQEAGQLPAELKQDAADWQQAVLDQVEANERRYMNISARPGQAANNRVEAFIQAHDFVDAFEAADEDQQFSPGELTLLSQLAANAKSSLYNTGSPPLFEFALAIDQIQRHAARGEWPQARDALAELVRTLPRRPEPDVFSPLDISVFVHMI